MKDWFCAAIAICMAACLQKKVDVEGQPRSSVTGKNTFLNYFTVVSEVFTYSKS